MKRFALLALLCTLTAPVLSCETFVSAGKTPPSMGGTGTESAGLASLGCRFHGKYDLELHYAGPVWIYDHAKEERGFLLLTVARVYHFEPKFLGAHPELYAGIGLKEAERCQFNGDENCNRRMPLPGSFHFGAGLEWSAVRIRLLHDSNNAMDHGTEKKNLGVTWLSLTLRF